MGLPVSVRFMIYNMLMYTERVIYVLPHETHRDALSTMMAVSRSIRFEIQRNYFASRKRRGSQSRAAHSIGYTRKQ